MQQDGHNILEQLENESESLSKSKITSGLDFIHVLEETLKLIKPTYWNCSCAPLVPEIS